MDELYKGSWLYKTSNGVRHSDYFEGLRIQEVMDMLEEMEIQGAVVINIRLERMDYE